MYRKDSELVPVGNNYYAALSKHYIHATSEELKKYFPKIQGKKVSKDANTDEVVSPDAKSLNTTNVAKKL